VAVELVVGLGVVFAAFAENVGADVQGGALLFTATRAKKKTTAVVYATTVLGI
jgi:hypothetical protein